MPNLRKIAVGRAAIFAEERCTGRFTSAGRGGCLKGSGPNAGVIASVAAGEGCRKRHTPPSVRFLGRRVYVGVVVVLISALRHGMTPARFEVLRFMKARGYLKRPRRGPLHSPGAQAAEHRYEAREIRSYESGYVGALWHLDFHHGSVRVLRPRGNWAYPLVLGILDDRSRLCRHLQWYLAEGARELCHGLGQAFLKRGLPRAILFDNGSAMVARQTREGLTRLGVPAGNTLPYSPYQNTPPATCACS